MNTCDLVEFKSENQEKSGRPVRITLIFLLYLAD